MIYFQMDAMRKMLKIVAKSDNEVAWFGVCERNEQTDDIIVHDILVYPQIDRATTFESDDDAYLRWHLSLDDKTVNSLRLHGHSHVYMLPHPSAPDLRNEKQKLAELQGNDEYYIFLIMNKMGEYTIRFVDRKNNIDERWEGDMLVLG